jgi:hypothetical protein
MQGDEWRRRDDCLPEYGDKSGGGGRGSCDMDCRFGNTYDGGKCEETVVVFWHGSSDITVYGEVIYPSFLHMLCT